MGPPKSSHEVISIEYEFKTAEVQQDFLTISTNCSRGVRLIELNITMTTRYSDMNRGPPKIEP